MNTPGQSIIPRTEIRAMEDMTFAEFIQTLDAWEVELLQDVEMDDDPWRWFRAASHPRRFRLDYLQ